MPVLIVGLSVVVLAMIRMLAVESTEPEEVEERGEVLCHREIDVNGGEDDEQPVLQFCKKGE